MKQVGIWDKPCKNNNDCFFYKNNNNYKNSYGGCKNGYCELPLDVTRVGYRYYLKDKKPYCYNCKTKSWKPITNLDTCCEEQNDKTKYPFLNSPDFAFNNDIVTRLNYYRQNNY